MPLLLVPLLFHEASACALLAVQHRQAWTHLVAAGDNTKRKSPPLFYDHTGFL